MRQKASVALLAAALIAAAPLAQASDEVRARGDEPPGGVAAPGASDGAGRPIAPWAERVGASGRRRAGSFAVALGASYGRTEALQSGADEAHHRTGGSLLFEATPLPWLALGLRLDGRYDTHTFGDGPAEDGWIGEPRLFAQLDRALGKRLSAGLRAVIWLPGGDAPSIVPAATTVDLAGLMTWVAGAGVRLTTLAGYRLDGSARSIDNAAALGPGDRGALMVSDFDAALVGVAAAYRRGRVDARAEWSADLLVGAGAPAVSSSPMRLGAGARLWVSPAWALEAGGELLTSARPPMPMAGALVPLPPRVSLLLGAVATFGPGARPAAPLPPAPPVVRAPASLRGRIAVPGQLPRGLTVALLRGDAAGRDLAVADDGSFSLDGVAPGKVAIVAEAPGWQKSRHELELVSGARAAVQVTLVRSGPSGQLRGIVRSFAGKPVVATVRISPRAAGAEGSEAAAWPALRSDDGAFSLQIDPGAYEIVVEAPGFEPQRRSVQVEEDGVTVLNVDLRGRGR